MSEKKTCPLLGINTDAWVNCDEDCKWLDARGNCAIEALHDIATHLSNITYTLEALASR